MHQPKLFSFSLPLFLLLSVTCTGAHKSRVRRAAWPGQAFTNIISNYFTKDPFFMSKPQNRRQEKAAVDRPRLHLPRRPPASQDQGSAEQRRASMLAPQPLRLGPPIRILPTVTTLNIKPQRPTTSFQHGRAPPPGDQIVRGRIPAPLLVGGEEAGGPPPRPRARTGRPDLDKTDQTFSQLILQTKKPEESAAAGPKFANFPSHEVRKKSSNFKLSPDMPFGFPGGERREEAPRITYRDEEELRYQNDYFKLPDYSNEISNEVGTDFEMMKRLKQKQKYKVNQYLPKQRFAEPLSYMNPLDKNHKSDNVEVFSASERIPTFTAVPPGYSHYKRQGEPYAEEPSPASQEYKPSKPPMHQPDRPTRNFRQDNSGFFKIPNLGFPLPAAGPARRQEADVTPAPPQRRTLPRVEAPLPNLNKLRSPLTTQSRRTPEEEQRERWNNPPRTTPRPTAPPPRPTAPPTRRAAPPQRPAGPQPQPNPHYQPTSAAKLAWGPKQDYDDYYYEDNEYDNYSSAPQSRSLPPPSPKSRASLPAHPQRSEIPAPLGPPPAILEMQHDSVFSGPFDVPKLGTNLAYTPPEMIYNQMHQRPQERSGFPSFQSSFIPPPKRQPPPRANSFSRPAPKRQSPTSAPFLPTPAKTYTPRKAEPFSEYGSLYDSPHKTMRRARQPIRQQSQPRPTQPSHQQPPKDFFRPISSPSITFEAGPSKDYNEKTLHNLVAEELDSNRNSGQAFLPFIEDEAGVVPPPPASHQLKDTLYHDYDPEPRYKRYQSVDYTPQHLDDYSYDSYSYEPERFTAEDPFHQVPTPQPIYEDEAAFLPPPPDFAPEHRGLPEFKTSDYYYKDSDYKDSDYNRGADYYTSDYNGPEYTHEYHIAESPEYYPEPEYHQGGLDAVSPDFHTNGLGSGPHEPQGLWGMKEDITNNANQFVNVAAPDTFEHGHVRGNPLHKKQEYTRREGRHFKSQVTWAAGDEGYGKHYFEYNH